VRPAPGSSLSSLSFEVRKAAYVRYAGGLNSELMNDDQARWIGDGLELVVATLGVLEQEHPKQ
jgi:hypothetical protein